MVACFAWFLASRSKAVSGRARWAGYLLCVGIGLLAGRSSQTSALGKPLFDAVSRGDEREVYRLLKNGANAAVEVDGKSAVCVAIEHNNGEIANFLVAHGANVVGFCDGKPLIRAAIDHNMWEMVNTLKDHGVRP